jgi:hypothetical protein
MDERHARSQSVPEHVAPAHPSRCGGAGAASRRGSPIVALPRPVACSCSECSHHARLSGKSRRPGVAGGFVVSGQAARQRRRLRPSRR